MKGLSVFQSSPENYRHIFNSPAEAERAKWQKDLRKYFPPDIVVEVVATNPKTGAATLTLNNAQGIRVELHVAPNTQASKRAYYDALKAELKKAGRLQFARQRAEEPVHHRGEIRKLHRAAKGRQLALVSAHQ